MMPEKKEKARDYTTVSIPMGLARRIDEFIKRKKDYQNRGDFVLEAVRKRLEEIGVPEGPQLPMLEHYNLSENGVSVLDRSIEPPKGRLIDVYFKPDSDNRLQARCEYDDTDRCRHVDFALELPEVQEIIRKKGWKIK
jgi:hypothetical protein